jgi:hypothetical protein
MSSQRPCSPSHRRKTLKFSAIKPAHSSEKMGCVAKLSDSAKIAFRFFPILIFFSLQYEVKCHRLPRACSGEFPSWKSGVFVMHLEVSVDFFDYSDFNESFDYRSSDNFAVYARAVEAP